MLLPRVWRRNIGRCCYLEYGVRALVVSISWVYSSVVALVMLISGIWYRSTEMCCFLGYDVGAPVVVIPGYGLETPVVVILGEWSRSSGGADT